MPRTPERMADPMSKRFLREEGAGVVSGLVEVVELGMDFVVVMVVVELVVDFPRLEGLSKNDFRILSPLSDFLALKLET